jgi:Protein of unknown function (DUF3611)
MSSEFEYSLPPAVRRISGSFRLVGWISFWIQVVLGVVSSAVLLFSSVSLGARSGGTPNPGTGAGLFLAGLGLLAAYISAFWAFRYARIGQRLRSRDTGKRPTPKEAIQALRLGLVISLAGMLLTLMGGQALIGSLLAKALAQPQGGAAIFNPNNVNQYVEAFDIFIIQANTNILLAHFTSVAATLWLLRTINRA